MSELHNLYSFAVSSCLLVLDKLCHLFESLAGHSIMPNDVKQLFSIMRPFEEGVLVGGGTRACVCVCVCARVCVWEWVVGL